MIDWDAMGQELREVRSDCQDEVIYKYMDLYAESQEVKERHWAELLDALAVVRGDREHLGVCKDNDSLRWFLIVDGDPSEDDQPDVSEDMGADYESLFKRLGLKP